MSDSKPGTPQVSLDGEGLVGDGVAVGERGEELVDVTLHEASSPRGAGLRPVAAASMSRR